MDGWIARKVPGQASKLGSFLDPLADKILVTTMYLSLTTASLMPAPLTALIISRDVLLVYAGLYIRYMSVKPPVSFFLIFFTRNTKYPVPLRNLGILGSKCSDTNANYLYNRDAGTDQTGQTAVCPQFSKFIK